MPGRWMVLAILVGLLLETAVACRPRGPYSPVARRDERKPHQLRHNVTVLDKDVRDALLFVNHTAKRTPNGQVQVRVQMQNLYRDETLWSEVRFAFYDADKMGVDRTEWQRVAFPPHEVVMIEGNSLRADVETYNVQFRNLKSSLGRSLYPPGLILEHGWWGYSIIPE
ncbi:MAG: hypothetical protein ACE5HE_04070 [Phycisphaerae bacterium]